MKLWVTGSSGMLGKRAVEAARRRGHDVIATTHWDCPIESLGVVMRLVHEARPDAIINCAGSLPGAHPIDMIQANTLGPHVLANTKIRLVHMSTNCVFSGRTIRHTRSTDLPDPADLYGRTKLAGEVDAPHVLNVRGSFIGPECGFLHWLLTAQGEVEAWDNAWWNGTTADIMAFKLVELAEGHQVGVVHVSSETEVSKGWMMQMFTDALNLPLEITHTEEPRIFRALEPDVILPATAKF